MTDIDFESLRPIGLTQSIVSQLHGMPSSAPDTRLVRVTQVHRDWLAVHDGVAEIKARALPRLLQDLGAQDLALSVGDWVLLNAEQWAAARVLPLNHVARRASDGRLQSLASNIDTALLVMGLDHDFNPRRLERYIALVRTAGVAPVVVLTKADIGIDVDQRMAHLRQRLPASIPALAVNALSNEAGAALAPWLGMAQTLILLGTSGAGKSTLTNTLCASAQETGGLRRGDGRGRHTTTARSLHLCASGACIVDTPGLRSWRADADEATLAASFDDIEELAVACQFRDCSHGTEPGCAVRGTVDADRLLNYHKLLREARRSQQTPLDRIAERSRWKALVKAAVAHARQKRE